MNIKEVSFNRDSYGNVLGNPVIIAQVKSWLRVMLVNSKEGVFGEYDPHDPDDINFLKCDIQIFNGVKWDYIEHGRFSTRIPAFSPDETIRTAIACIGHTFRNFTREEFKKNDHKKLIEALSYIAPKHVQ